MIMAGDYIDLTLGARLGLSTLAAAGIGNWFSDIVGLGAGGYIGDLSSKLGLASPQLTETQQSTRAVRLSRVILHHIIFSGLI